jgi:hypothetical protein
LENPDAEKKINLEGHLETFLYDDVKRFPEAYAFSGLSILSNMVGDPVSPEEFLDNQHRYPVDMAHALSAVRFFEAFFPQVSFALQLFSRTTDESMIAAGFLFEHGMSVTKAGCGPPTTEGVSMFSSIFPVSLLMGEGDANNWQLLQPEKAPSTFYDGLTPKIELEVGDHAAARAQRAADEAQISKLTLGVHLTAFFLELMQMS